QILPRYGISIDLVDVDKHDEIERLVEGARILYCETIGNPRMEVADLPALAKLAEAAGATLVVDNTFASPLVCRPLEHGAHVSVHSATKFLGGHHDLMGGVVCASDSLLEPIREIGRDLGGTLAPFNAWLALRGMKTLHLRVDRACDSALLIAQALADHEDVSAVHYPALDTDPGKPLADLLLGGRGGGTLAFDVAGGRERAARFQASLRLIKPAASLGGSHTLITHAASVTHTQLGPEELRAAGISEGFCRLAVGLEDADDLIEDVFQALHGSR
ncbi:MAG TPA: PLP-dependent transferase, partial [Actinomycetota bacterium]|nr:PLP-dependent transferase [Actinomycetota bacterium]